MGGSYRVFRARSWRVLATAGAIILALAGGSCVPSADETVGSVESLSMSHCASLLEPFRVGSLSDRRFNHETFWNSVEPYLDAFEVQEIGQSVEGRALRAISFGTGETRVLLWSQMHGDESTATMALADLFHFLSGSDDPLPAILAEKLSVTFVPMLNPDGAESFQRHNALGVDINRDAKRLATPEGRALKTLRDSLEPHFGFNLHDQGARTLAGENGSQVGIALLAPAHDASRAYNAVRSRARLVASTLAGAFLNAIPGHVAKYDDTYEPRAFGDNMQTWGTSTILIESGALPGDPDKQRLRELNAAALLMILDAIANEHYTSADPNTYESLPFNERIGHDVIIRGGEVVVAGETYRLDVGVVFDEPVERRLPTLGEVGDLSTAEALEDVRADGMFVHVDFVGEDPPMGRMVRGEPVRIRVSKGRSPESESVLEIR